MWDDYWGADNGGNFDWLFDEYPLPDILDSAQNIIETAEKNKDSDCAKLLGPDALEKFKKLRKDGKINYNGKDLGETTGAETDGDNMRLNPDSYTFDPDKKPFIIDGYKSNNAIHQKNADAFNKAFKKSGANSRYDYAIATVIHEFLHAIGKFGPDVSEDIVGNKDSSQSRENQKRVIEACLNGGKKK